MKRRRSRPKPVSRLEQLSDKRLEQLSDKEGEGILLAPVGSPSFEYNYRLDGNKTEAGATIGILTRKINSSLISEFDWSSNISLVIHRVLNGSAAHQKRITALGYAIFYEKIDASHTYNGVAVDECVIFSVAVSSLVFDQLVKTLIDVWGRERNSYSVFLQNSGENSKGGRLYFRLQTKNRIKADWRSVTGPRNTFYFQGFGLSLQLPDVEDLAEKAP